MHYRDKLYRRVHFSISCRTAVALSQLQVESCIAVLYCIATVKADAGASNHANLGLLRFPCFQSLLSSRRASANTFGFCVSLARIEPLFPYDCDPIQQTTYEWDWNRQGSSMTVA